MFPKNMPYYLIISKLNEITKLPDIIKTNKLYYKS